MDHKETFVNAGWDPTLVVLFFVVAVFASYTSLDLAAAGSLRRRRRSNLERTTHALKGSRGNLGARKMAETAGLLEEAGHGGDLSAAPGLLDRLDVEFSQTRAESSALLLKG